MKLILSTVTALMLTTVAAMAFSFPAHQQNGYRDTGCDKAANVEIKNAKGEVLYLNNPTCPTARASTPHNLLDDLAAALEQNSTPNTEAVK
ncbi:MAG: hypothetical protein ACK4MS_10525 [Paracoccaceae bacterium]